MPGAMKIMAECTGAPRRRQPGLNSSSGGVAHWLKSRLQPMSEEDMRANRELSKAGFGMWLVIAAAAAHAHHGWSEYDSSKALELTGVIRESGYEHPHGHVRLEAPGKTWLVILAPPSRMRSRGLPAEALKPGNPVTVIGYPNRSKPEEMRAERIRADGKIVELR
jgi:hypothetical protein